MDCWITEDYREKQLYHYYLTYHWPLVSSVKTFEPGVSCSLRRLCSRKNKISSPFPAQFSCKRSVSTALFYSFSVHLHFTALVVYCMAVFLALYFNFIWHILFTWICFLYSIWISSLESGKTTQDYALLPCFSLPSLVSQSVSGFVSII